MFSELNQMRIILTLSLIVLIALSAGACSKQTPELKSPCAGNEGSPCGPKRKVNDWWLG